MRKLTEAERLRGATAYHEVGHAVAAVLAGARIMKVELHDDDPNTPGSCTFVDLPEGHDFSVTYAGPWCEARWLDGGPYPRHTAIRAALAASPSDRDALSGSSPGPTQEIARVLETCWPVIAELAGTLYRNGTLKHRDVTEALGIPLIGGEQSMAASMIRAGHAPGTFTVTQPA